MGAKKVIHQSILFIEKRRMIFSKGEVRNSREILANSKRSRDVLAIVSIGRGEGEPQFAPRSVSPD